MRHLQDVFRIGDKVRAVILGMDEDFTRISLSTAELEETDGDMVEKKVCFRNISCDIKLQIVLCLRLKYMTRMSQRMCMNIAKL